MRRKYIIISLMTLFTTTTFAQDTLGFSADLYKYLLKNDDFNKDGILSQSEINYICCVQLKNMKSIKGISKLVNLKYVTLELGEYDYSELFQLSEVIDLKVNSNKIKRKFSIPRLCDFSTTLFSLKIENCIINQESKNLTSLNTFEIDNCTLESDISDVFTIKQMKKLEIRRSVLNYSINIKQQNESLKYLSIHETNINEIPKSIDNLIGAETINISNCNLTNMPNTINNLTKLTNLTLTGNSFDSFPTEILLVQSLKYLDLRGNKKQLKLPSDIDKLVNLENIPILLPNNEAIPKEIYKITKLKELYLIGRKLESIPEGVFNLTHLERIYLNDNKIKEIEENIANLRQLKQLHINRNKLTKIPKSLSLLKNLEEIDLSDNEVVEFYVNCDSLQKLRTIRLSNNKLNNFPYELKKCLKLSTINLQNNNISSIEQIKYGDFQSAYIIEIYGNPIVTNSPIIQKKDSIIQLKITGAEDKYNSYNLTEAILKSSPKDIIFSGVILNKELNKKSKRSFKDVICKVKVLDCYHDNCNPRHIDYY
ncbi:MAG: hypothetical protein IPN89_01545 [Saprospiraceae bacterium]|nr:hypothetical protein [Saprospiraceae bacterium]